MSLKKIATAFMLLFAFGLPGAFVTADEGTTPPAERKLVSSGGLPVIVRMQGPYDADVALQVVCYFKRTETSDQRMTGAPIELDKRLSGVIGSLRTRGEFSGEALETLLIKTPAGAIQAKSLLLVGLGDEASLSRPLMEAVGRTALREAAQIGADTVAFAPLIKDQGNDALPAGDVASSVARGMLLAYDTDQKQQQQGLANPFVLKQWILEAGPKYFDETTAGVQKSIDEVKKTLQQRDAKPYATAVK